MPTLSLRNSAAATVKADALVIGVHGNDKAVSSVAASSTDVTQKLGKNFLSTLNDMGVSAERGQVSKVPGGDTAAAVVVVAGLGPEGEVSLESLRKASGAAARALAGKQTIAYALPASTDEQVRAVSEGALLGAYGFDRYREEKSGAVGTIVVLTELARSKSAKQAAAAAEIVADAVNLARDLVNVPPNDLYPDSFAQQMVARAKRSKVNVDVMEDKELEAKGYGGIMGVGKGSQRPPRLVTLSYKPRGAHTHLALVGKGITFDSGG
ncbi:MAG: leucyl aminopeptidase, partial [Nocardioidaceae bacterium]|nr:leucyl aminopeptidase [Nocardioidaceae bacterium]